MRQQDPQVVTFIKVMDWKRFLTISSSWWLFRRRTKLETVSREVEILIESLNKKEPKMKHNKKRNTAFLYECLIKEMTKAVVRGELKEQTNC